MKIVVIKLYLLFITVFTLSCVSDMSDSKGTGHDGEMKVIGAVYDKMGNPIEELNVRILPSDFNPISDTLNKELFESSTGINGEYEFTIQDSGYYTISAYHDSLNAYLYIDSILISKELEDQGIDTLKEASILTVINQNYDSLSGNNLIVYLLGSDLVIDTLYSDSSQIYIPTDTVNIKISTIDDNTTLIKTGSVIPDDTTSNKIIIKDSSEVFTGKLTISTLGQTGSLWEMDMGDTLPIYLNLVDSSDDSSIVDVYSISWIKIGSGEKALTALDSNFFNFVCNDSLIDTVKIVGKAEIRRFSNTQTVDTLEVFSDTIDIIINSTFKDYYISFTGRDTVFQNDTAAYLISSNFDTTDSSKYTIIYWPYFKAPSDSVFKKAEYSVYNLFSNYFYELGEYQLYVKADIIELDSIGNEIDTIEVYSDTASITVVPTSLLGSMALTADKNSGYLGEPFSFAITFKDTFGDTLTLSDANYLFQYNDGSGNIYKSEPSDTHTFYSTGTYIVVGQILADSGYNFSDSIIISVLTDSSSLDSVFPELPAVPTGTGSLTINSNRYYVTDGDPFIYNSDTLEYEYRFTWDDTITDSIFSPSTILPDASDWDTLPYAENGWDSVGIYLVRVQKRFKEYPDKLSDWSAPIYVKVFESQSDTLIDTTHFKIPQRPVGDDTLAINTSGTFITQGASCIIPGGVQYRFNWGDGELSSWSNNAYAQKMWDTLGTYYVSAQARSVSDTAALSEWSISLIVLVNTTGRIKTK